MRSLEILPALLLPLSLFACDSTVHTDGPTFRRDGEDDGSGKCKDLTTGSSGTGLVKGRPNPLEDGSFPAIAEADPTWIADLQTRMADSATSAMALSIDGAVLEESCDAVCARDDDLTWNGQGCIADATFDFGTMDYDEFSNGEIAVVAEVAVQSTFGCSCN